MARDVTGNPWKFDATGQGEGFANASTWLRLSTFTGAATDIVTMTAHGLVTGSQVRVEEGAADLPDGLAESTDYWVGKIDADTFKLYATHAAALATGTAVDITDAGTTPNYILMQPVFPVSFYIKNIILYNNDDKDGTTLINTTSGGRVLASKTWSGSSAENKVVVIPVYSYVEGIYITSILTDTTVLVYHGK